MAADTDDLDEFVAVGDRLQVSVAGMWETLARQRNDLLGIGLRTVVERSEIAAVGNTIGAMAELDRFVTNISAALQRYGEDLGDGRFRAAVSVVDNRLDHANDPRFDALEAALAAEGLRPPDAARIRDEVEAIVGYDSRFQIDGVTASEPGRLAAVLVADIQRRAADLIENNHVGSSSLHSEPVVSVDR